MNSKSFFIFALVFVFGIKPTSAQYISSVTKPNTSIPKIYDENDKSFKYGKTISAKDLKEHLTYLASDACEGRETGQKGNLKAAEYIASQFKKMEMDNAGLQNFMQPVKFTFSSWSDTDLYIHGNRFKHLWDYIAYPAKNNNMPIVESKNVLFLGYGIDDAKYSDYEGKSFENAVIIINNGEPMKADSTYWITGTQQPSEWSGNLNKKLEAAYKRGVQLVLIIDEDIKKTLGENRKYLLGPTVELGEAADKGLKLVSFDSKDKNRSKAWNANGSYTMKPNYAFISTTVAKEIFGKSDDKIIKERANIIKKGKFKPVELKTDFKMNMAKEVKTISSQNVVGFIKGSAEPNEVVIVSAHYDHLGKKGDQTFYGADDNGSGTSTVIELAQAFKKAQEDGFGPKRSIAFILMTGEEKGLLGSEYYTQNPVFKLENTVANVNIDMVGRVDQKYKDNPDYIYVIGSDRLSSELHTINEEANQKYTQITLDYKYNAEDDANKFYYRSDHYNFASKGIPAIFYFNGVHEDYHQPSDTVEKINFSKMEKVGKLIFHTIWELANRPDRIKVDGLIK